MDCPSDNGKPTYAVFYFWTRQNNAPRVLREVSGYPKIFDTKEEAVKWISDHVDDNVNITYCITKGDQWDLAALTSFLTYEEKQKIEARKAPDHIPYNNEGNAIVCTDDPLPTFFFD